MIVTDSSLKPARWRMDNTMTTKGGKCPWAWTASKCVKLVYNVATRQPTPMSTSLTEIRWLNDVRWKHNNLLNMLKQCNSLHMGSPRYNEADHIRGRSGQISRRRSPNSNPNGRRLAEKIQKGWPPDVEVIAPRSPFASISVKQMLANICPGDCEACTCLLRGTSRQMPNISYDSLTCMWGKSPRPSLDSRIKMCTGQLDSGDEMFQELPAFIVLLVLLCESKINEHWCPLLSCHDPLPYPPLNVDMRSWPHPNGLALNTQSAGRSHPAYTVSL